MLSISMRVWVVPWKISSPHSERVRASGFLEKTSRSGGQRDALYGFLPTTQIRSSSAPQIPAYDKVEGSCAHYSKNGSLGP